MVCNYHYEKENPLIWQELKKLETYTLFQEFEDDIKDAETWDSTKEVIEKSTAIYEKLKILEPEKMEKIEKEFSLGDKFSGSGNKLREKISEEAKKLIKEIIEKTPNYFPLYRSKMTKPYRIYTTKDDKIKSISRLLKTPRAKLKTELKEVLEKNRQIQNSVLRYFKTHLVALSLSRWEENKLRGKLNNRHLYRIVTGKSKTIYKELVIGRKFNTVCSLWIDHSGSMSGKKAELAAQASVIFGECLNTLNIPFEIMGYSTSTEDVLGMQRYTDSSDQEKVLYTRWGDLWLAQYKTFKQSWSNHAHYLLGIPYLIQYNTYDGEVIKLATNRLLKQPESRKILFIFCDGEPCSDTTSIPGNIEQFSAYMKEMAGEADKLVEVVAVGITTSAVKDYFRYYIVVNELEDLPGVVAQKLRQLLVSKKGAA
jgi:cobalamin biosynthesis protein CobT